MRKFIVARHAEYEEVAPSHPRYHPPKPPRAHLDILTPAGERQAALLGTSLKDLLGYDSTYMISSDANRAVQTSEIIREILGVSSFDLSGNFNSDNFYFFDAEDVLKCGIGCKKDIEERENLADTLIVVTHHRIIPSLPNRFARERMGLEIKLDMFRNGQAIYFDLETNQYQMVPK